MNKKSKAKQDTDEEEYIVEKIVGKKVIDGRDMYEIKWVGWPHKYNTMEPIEHLTQSTVQEMVAIFNSKNDIKKSVSKAKPPVQKDLR